jgi:hypothetical protein
MRPRVRSVFSDERKLSIAALSHTLPDRLIEQVPPQFRHEALKLRFSVTAVSTPPFGTATE